MLKRLFSRGLILHSGCWTPIPENSQKCSSCVGIEVQHKSEWVFTLIRNRCSSCSGICRYLRPSYFHYIVKR